MKSGNVAKTTWKGSTILPTPRYCLMGGFNAVFDTYLFVKKSGQGINPHGELKYSKRNHENK